MLLFCFSLSADTITQMWRVLPLNPSTAAKHEQVDLCPHLLGTALVV